MPQLTHLNDAGDAHMVNVTAKQPTARSATALARVTVSPEIAAALQSGSVPKGDVLAISRVAGIAAAKRVPELLPLAHVIGIHGVEIDITIGDDGVKIRATVHTVDRTGVEMEALTAATVAALNVVDMVKSVDRSAAIAECVIIHKSGGRSGEWHRPGYEAQ